MKCSLCGFTFNDNQAEAACAGCGLGNKCGLVKCPNCGFETAPAPEFSAPYKGGIMEALLNRLRRNNNDINR